LNILCNLTNDLRFAKEAIKYKQRLSDLKKNVFSKNFIQLVNQAIEKIDKLKEKLKEGYKPNQKYRQSFTSKEYAEK
jgi:hypothetical protein